MALRFRRLVVVSLAALALTAGGAATAASASALHPRTVSDGFDDGPGGYPGGHGRPLHLGPFEFPRSGSISGGFQWGVRD
ncbi:hypothetical protein [Streptomyces sp. NPDC003015]